MTLGIGKNFLRGFIPYYIEGLFSHLSFQKGIPVISHLIIQKVILL